MSQQQTQDICQKILDLNDSALYDTQAKIETFEDRLSHAEAQLAAASSNLPWVHNQRQRQQHRHRVANLEKIIELCEDHVIKLRMLRKNFVDDWPTGRGNVILDYLEESEVALVEEIRSFGAQLEEATSS